MDVSAVDGVGRVCVVCPSRLILGGISKAICGYGIDEYKDGLKGMVGNIQTNYLVFSGPPTAADGKEKEAFNNNVAYLQEALKQVGNRGKDMLLRHFITVSIWMRTH